MNTETLSKLSWDDRGRLRARIVKKWASCNGRGNKTYRLERMMNRIERADHIDLMRKK